jgi:putative ABC transport system substrate-binding protein
VAVLVTADNPSKPQNVQQVQLAASALGVNFEVEDIVVNDPSRAFDSARAWAAEALLFIGDAVLSTLVQPLVALVDQLHLPSIFNGTQFVDAGGLMAYGVDTVAEWSHAADFVDKILRRSRPADLPVEDPTEFVFVVNTRTAGTLGLTIPASVAAQVTGWV